MNQNILTEVLQPQPLTKVRQVKPAVIPVGTMVHSVIAAGAAELRAVYHKGTNTSVKRKDKKTGTGNTVRYNDACMDTFMAYDELNNTVEDDLTLALAYATYEHAGFISEELRPTYPSTQREMQQIALAVARNARNFLATQQPLNLGA